MAFEAVINNINMSLVLLFPLCQVLLSFQNVAGVKVEVSKNKNSIPICGLLIDELSKLSHLRDSYISIGFYTFNILPTTVLCLGMERDNVQMCSMELSIQ